MDVAALGCSVDHLNKDELIHELSIRRFPGSLDASRDDLRKQLRQLLKLSRRGSICIKPPLELDSTAEVECASPKVSELCDEVEKGAQRKSFPRLVARCNYWIKRLSSLDDLPEEGRKLASRLLTCLALLDEVLTEGDSEQESDEISSPNHSKVIYKSERKRVNFNSFNLKFRGDSCVRGFLTRLEELLSSRDVSKKQAFTGFAELLDGPALHWYRANVSSCHDYDSLVALLRKDFDLPDYDYKLLQEIRNRTQAKTETTVSFLSIILGMCSRLSNDISEAEKLDIILRNIRPDYSSHLALCTFTSVNELKIACRKLELSKVRSQDFAEPKLVSNPVNSDFICKAKPTLDTKNRYNNLEVDSLQPKVGPAKTNSRMCFRCGQSGHPTHSCKTNNDIVCFKCGNKGVRTPDCTKCKNSKN